MTELNQLITTLQEFVQSVKSTPESKRSAKDVIATQNLSFDPFDAAVESFDCYSQRLENYFKLKGLSADDPETEELKVLVLINCLGSRQYQLLSSLTAPDIPSTKTFQELLLLLKKHLSPKPNVLTEQHKFFSRHQHQGPGQYTFLFQYPVLHPPYPPLVQYPALHPPYPPLFQYPALHPPYPPLFQYPALHPPYPPLFQYLVL
nr:uncharacterized protein LOC122269685 [Parasteatoda tepidariorum]